ncbi:MAG: guanylate kinase [Firmicutes bacterium]|nr:guanylate kinase [Bacillota bacterium]
MKNGILVVISGPSGAGKGTIVGRILKELDNIGFSTSMTTRSPREGEVDGRDYFFVTEEEFKKAIDEDAFVEYANVHGNYYGTPKSEVASRLERGMNVLLDIDVQGAMNVKKQMPEGVFIFISPPSMEELRARLEGRGKDSAEDIERRLKNAEGEMKLIGEYDYHVVNDDLDTAVEEVKEIIIKEEIKEGSSHDAISGN